MLVVVEAEVVAPDGGNVIWLRRVRLGVVICEEDALAFEVCDVRVVDYFGEVLPVVGKVSVMWNLASVGRKRRIITDLVLQPYRDEPIERTPSLDNLELGLASAQRQCRHKARETNQKMEYRRHHGVFMLLLLNVVI